MVQRRETLTNRTRIFVNIAGGEDVTYGRLNDNLLTALGWSRTHSIKED